MRSRRANGMPQKVDFSSFAGPINLFGLEDITLKTKSQGKVCIFTIYVSSVRNTHKYRFKKKYVLKFPEFLFWKMLFAF